jgi:DNA-binding transcriptional MerR regulator
MDESTDDRIDIDELARRAGARLAELGVAQANGQVTAVPDARTLRWYTTVGLLDRPVERRGRRAYYDARHVAQVVAVKRLQAEGASLTEIAVRLAGLSTAALDEVARDPGAPVPADALTTSVTTEPADAADVTFAAGAIGPAAVDRSPAPSSTSTPVREPDPSGRTASAFWAASTASRQRPVTGVLGGITLDAATAVTFAAARPLTEADVEAVRRAAGPLLDELRRRSLVPVPLHTDLPKDRH